MGDVTSDSFQDSTARSDDGDSPHPRGTVPLRASGVADDEAVVCESGTVEQGRVESREGESMTSEEGEELSEAWLVIGDATTTGRVKPRTSEYAGSSRSVGFPLSPKPLPCHREFSDAAGECSCSVGWVGVVGV